MQNLMLCIRHTLQCQQKHREMRIHFQWRCVLLVSTSCLYFCMYANAMYFHYSALTVDADEIKRLGKRFRKLDLDNSGSLSIDEFMSLPELQQNPLVQRVIDIFDTDGNGEVDFKGKKGSYTPRSYTPGHA